MFENVVRGFSLVHDPKGSRYENFRGDVSLSLRAKRSNLCLCTLRLLRRHAPRNDVARLSLQDANLGRKDKEKCSDGL